MITYKSNLEKISLVKEPTSFKRVKITRSSDINEYVRNFYDTDIEIYESFFIVLLNRSINTIGYVKISQGGVAGTVVDPKIVAKYAIESLCSSIILVHNHPSGDTKPSKEDKRLTKTITEGLNYFNIVVLDHLIITKDSYYSFADEGILQNI